MQNGHEMTTCRIMPTYARLPVAFVRGEGAWLWDAAGKKYLDAISGVAVCGLGHAHPGVADAIARQAGTLMHTSNLYRVPLQEQLALQLTALSGMDNVFFANSGAEANEAALKIARRHGHEHGIAAPEVVVMEGSFHGRTLATLSATGNPKVQQGFEPLFPGFVRVPYDDLDAIRALSSPHITAVLVEPVQGEGGVRVPSPAYLVGLRRLCDERGWLLMFDEVQTGVGRTGTMFAFQHAGITPDVMTLAKALGNGVPIGACLARGAAAALLLPGQHASTFGGNPLVCAAALAVLDALESGGLVQRAGILGGRILTALSTRLAGLSQVRSVRGLGLMLGIELDRPCGELVGRALAAGLLINVTAERVVRLLPPLILSDVEADELVGRVACLVEEFLSS